MYLLNSKKSLLLVCGALVVSLLSLVYSTNIHSDILFMKFFLDDISSGGRWSNWRLSPAPSYFPDLIIYALAHTLTSLVPVQIILTTAAQAIIITLLATGLIKKLNPFASPTARIAIIALTLLCVITSSHYTPGSGIGIFFGSSNIQVPTLISSLAMLWLTLSMIESKSKTKTLIFLLVGMLGYASSAAFIICFSTPFIATLSAFAIHSKLNRDNYNLQQSVLTLFLFVISQALGYALSKIITFNAPLDGRIPLSLDGAKNSATLLLKGTQFIFRPEISIAFFTAIVFLTIFLYALVKCIRALFILTRKTSKYPTSISEKLVILFFLTSTVSSVFGSILSGGFADIFGYRYFETFIAVSAILALHFIDKASGVKTKLHLACCITIFSVAIAATSTLLLERSRSLSFSELLVHGAFTYQAPSTAHCLDNLISSGVPLKAGVANYWFSRSVMFYAKNKIFINQSDNNLLPFFWISSIEPIKKPEKYNASFYNYVIADNAVANRIMGFDTESLKSKLPKGYQIFSCTGSSSDVFYYPNNNFDLHIKEVHRKFLISQIGHGSATFLGSELPGLIGTADGTSRSVSARDGSGILSFGPYLSLLPGKYLATLRFHAENEGNRSAGRIEIGNFVDEPHTILYSGELPKNRNAIDMEFSVDGEALDKIEARVIFNGTGSLTIHNLDFLWIK